MKDKMNQILNISKYLIGLLGVGLCIWLVAADYPDSDAELSEIDTFITGIYEVKNDQEDLGPLALKYTDTTEVMEDVIDTLRPHYKNIVEDFVLNEMNIQEMFKKYEAPPHKLSPATIDKRINHGVNLIEKEIEAELKIKETIFVRNWKKRKEEKIADLKSNIKIAKDKKEKEILKLKLDNTIIPKVINTGEKLKNGEEYIVADIATIQKGDEINVGKSYSFLAIDYVIYVIGLALLGVIAFFIYSLIIRPKVTALSILGLIISASLFLILFSIGSTDSLSDLQLDPEKVKVGLNTIDMTTAGILTIGICLFIGLNMIIYGAVIGRLAPFEGSWSLGDIKALNIISFIIVIAGLVFYFFEKQYDRKRSIARSSLCGLVLHGFVALVLYIQYYN